MTGLLTLGQRFNREKFMMNLFGAGFLALLSLIIIVPFYYLFVSSLKDLGQYAQTDFKTMWAPWPLHFENYTYAVTLYKLGHYITNSLWLGAAQTALQVLSSCLVAYGFSRFKFPGRDVLFVILLASMFLPTEVTQIPLYQLYRAIGWTNSFYPLIVPNAFGNAWSIFMMRQMMLNIPREIDEAAWMDGAGTFRVFWQILMPQVKPAIVVVTLFGFLGSWKDLFGPLLYLQDSKFYTLPVGLVFFVGLTDRQLTWQAAAVVVALVPTILLYVFGQRYFESGIVINELK
jgi:multiple sugar transport system permease protein